MILILISNDRTNEILIFNSSFNFISSINQKNKFNEKIKTMDHMKLELILKII